MDEEGNIIKEDEVKKRIMDELEKEGEDEWFEDGERESLIGEREGEGWKKVRDIIEVWLD